MSGKLVGEVLDYAPADLGDKALLMLVAIAESARDDTRIGWPGREDLARRVRCTESSASRMIRRLVELGLLERMTTGHRGSRSAYRIPDLKGVPQETPNVQPKGVPKGVPQEIPNQVERVSPSDVKGVPQETPLPSIPSTTEPKGSGAAPAATAQTLIAEWIDHCAKRPPGTVIAQVGRHLAGLIGEGIDPGDIRNGLAAWSRKGLHPSTLPSVVNEVMNGHGPGVPRPSTTDQRIGAALALAAKYEQLEPKELTP